MTAVQHESTGPQVQAYLLPILQVLADGESRTSKQLREEVYDLMGLTEEQRSFTHEKSGQRRADVRSNLAVHHLRRAEAVEGGYGVARITGVGRRLLSEHPDGVAFADLEQIPAYRDYVPQKEGRPEAVDFGEADEDAPGEVDEARPVWFVGAAFEDPETDEYRDHTPDFVRTGTWRIHPDSRQQLRDYVAQMRPGDRIAIKAVYIRRYGVPFETHGHPVSMMDIKATGVITGVDEDSLTAHVRWEQDYSQGPLHWYLFTYQPTIWKVDPSESANKAALVDFAFAGVPQDLHAFRNDPYWADRFGDGATDAAPDEDDDGEDVDDPGDVVDVEDEVPAYTTESIIADGGFLEKDELEAVLRTWRQKKNLILQGPPGTGKTWLAKRLARVLTGSEDASLITAVQFHPTVSYEDFVRGWRPAGDGTLTLVDGVLLQIAHRAAAEPDRVHVLVIEEINRGNLAQIFGEMLTLLEADKRTREQAMQLAYRRDGEGPFHLPENLYVVGTMNLADRSLAMVDFALRRRFGFADLTPQYGLPWATWVSERITGADMADVQRLGNAVNALNAHIVDAPGLGDQYQVGHSFLTPAKNARQVPFRPWAESVIRQEIRPLLTEYWFDQTTLVDEATDALLAALPAS